MVFDPQLAQVISDRFRETCSQRLTNENRLGFEELLQRILGIKNLRNVQLWTRYGSVQRNIINSRLGEYELDIRVFLADRFVQNATPFFPVKTKAFQLPADSETARKFLLYLNDNWIREYCTRIYTTSFFVIIEYAADSDSDIDRIDMDSDEFADVLED